MAQRWLLCMWVSHPGPLLLFTFSSPASALALGPRKNCRQRYLSQSPRGWGQLFLLGETFLKALMFLTEGERTGRQVMPQSPAAGGRWNIQDDKRFSIITCLCLLQQWSQGPETSDHVEARFPPQSSACGCEAPEWNCSRAEEVKAAAGY